MTPASPCATPAAFVLDKLKEVVFQTDTAGHLLFLNPAWEELTGYQVGAAVGKSFLDHVHPEDAVACLSLFEPLVAGEIGDCQHEVRYRHRDGGVRWVEVFARPVRDADGRVTGTVGTLTDITRRKAADDKLRLAALVFQNAGEGIVITGGDGAILDVNAAFEAISGYRREEVLGKNPSLLSSGRQDASFYKNMWTSLATDGYWQGEVCNRRKTGEFYVERLTITSVRDGAGRATNYLGIFTDITLQKQQAENLEQMAHYDPLTGLPNRRLLADRLQQAMGRSRRDGTRVAVAYLDLDGFKAVNDVQGHECGDALLITIGRRMRNAVREFDTVCRIGGDEFVVVIGDLRNEEDCLPTIARLLGSVAQPVMVDSVRLSVTGSLGLAFYPQETDIDADQLMRQADQAMYRAKELGKNRYCVFDSAEHRSTMDRNGMLEEIARGIERREFVLHYQPIVDLRSGELNSVEALIRWQHPRQGLLAPGDFLPALDGHPLMAPLEDWILNEALDQHERWLAAGWDIAVSVNMSGSQLHQKDFVARLRAMLAARPRVNPARLKLEVLESSALDDIAHVSKTISQCAELGVSFSLDDFGTGYSSLRYLKQLPARRIKIDQGFVKNMLQDPDDLAILEAVIGMAAAFKRDVIAEGVESMEHAKMLLQLGCVKAQGYGIARPMPGDQVTEWAAGWTLPESLQGCPTLGRDDALLLGAIVEYRAWTAAVMARAEAASATETQAPGAESRLDQWLALAEPDLSVCPVSLRDMQNLRQEAHDAAMLVLAPPEGTTASDRRALAQDFDARAKRLLAALGGLMEKRAAAAA